MKVPLPPRIPSVILEEFEEDTIQELADTMEPGVVFSTEDHTYVLTKDSWTGDQNLLGR